MMSRPSVSVSQDCRGRNIVRWRDECGSGWALPDRARGLAALLDAEGGKDGFWTVRSDGAWMTVVRDGEKVRKAPLRVRAVRAPVLANRLREAADLAEAERCRAGG